MTWTGVGAMSAVRLTLTTAVSLAIPSEGTEQVDCFLSLNPRRLCFANPGIHILSSPDTAV